MENLTLNTFALKKDFIKIVKDNIHRDGIDDLMNYIENETDFYTAPASSNYHSNHEGGLVEHSINVYNRLKTSSIMNNEFSGRYSDETIAIVSLFHDLCKTNFYKVEMRNTKNDKNQWVKVPYYKIDEAYPYGHGEKSVYMLMKYIKLTDEEALAINWHMGGFDSRVKGGSYEMNGAYNMSPLALELHIADLRATFVDENK